MSSKSKSNATDDEARPALMPKRRFSEFRGTKDWEYKLIGSYLEDVSGRVPPNTELPVYSSTRDGLKRQDAYFDGRVLQNKNEYGIVPPGCVVYRHMSDDGLFKFNINETGGEIAVSKEYPVFRTKGLNPTFLLAKLNDGLDFRRFALSQKAGGTRTRLYFSRLCEWRTLLPSLAEQNKIADCLSSLDELIAAQARKVDALKTHKKGLMQQLFPREGKTQPRLRFPEFQSAGEWVGKAIVDIAPLQRGFDLPSDDIRPGSIPIVYSNGPKGFHERGMAKGPGLVTGRSGTLGKFHFIETGDYWPHNTSLWVTGFNSHYPRFVYYLYESIGFLRFASGSGVPTLNRNDAHAFETSVPSQTAEQQRIATFLSNLDALIAAEAQKLETLKTHKNGLMQQLFPSPEEAA